jgi:hypothetical protein
MLKKLMALASLTALMGGVSSVAMAGCSSETDSDPAPDASADAPRDRVAPDVTEPPTEPEICPVGEAVDLNQFPFKGPRVIPGACTGEDITALVKEYEDKPTGDLASRKAFMDARSEECTACIWAADGDEWAPMVTSATRVDWLNVGGCVAIVSEDEACGKAYQQYFYCTIAACLDCEDGEFQECRGAAAQGEACDPARQALISACGQSIGDYLNACQGDKYVFEESIRKQCVGVGDGGADGG